MVSSSSDSSNQAKNPLTHLLDNVSSYDGNVMLAAFISLLLVILFVLLLHIYAKWFLAQARQRRRRSSISASHVLRPAHRFHHFHSFTFDNSSTISSSPSKGLDASMIASIPLFVYTSNDDQCKQGLECVICLSGFEDNEVGRSLPKCGHGFHVECIDMWLNSHSNCPICRAPVVGDKSVATVLNVVESDGSNSMERANVELLEIVVEGELSRLERVSDISNCEISDHDMGESNDSLSSTSSPSTSSANSSPLGYCSLKRMLSRNRSSSHECKAFPLSKDLVQDA